MPYYYLPNQDVLKNEEDVILLFQVSKEDIKNIRLKEEQFLIIKKNSKLYTLKEKEDISTIHFGKCKHLCTECNNFFKCPKVMEREPSELTEENYEESCRIEKYPFISLGYENKRYFYVWKCKKYVPTPSKKRNKTVNTTESTNETSTNTTEREKTHFPDTEEERLDLAFPNRPKHEELRELIDKIS